MGLVGRVLRAIEIIHGLAFVAVGGFVLINLPHVALTLNSMASKMKSSAQSAPEGMRPFLHFFADQFRIIGLISVVIQALGYVALGAFIIFIAPRLNFAPLFNKLATALGFPTTP